MRNLEFMFFLIKKVNNFANQNNTKSYATLTTNNLF